MRVSRVYAALEQCTVRDSDALQIGRFEHGSAREGVLPEPFVTNASTKWRGMRVATPLCTRLPSARWRMTMRCFDRSGFGDLAFAMIAAALLGVSAGCSAKEEPEEDTGPMPSTGSSGTGSDAMGNAGASG